MKVDSTEYFVKIFICFVKINIFLVIDYYILEFLSSYYALNFRFCYKHIYIYIYIHTRFQKGFHIERYIDRYMLLFSCTCARVHFSLVIVQLVKKLGSTMRFLFVRFLVPISWEKKMTMHEYCLQFSCFAYS